MSAAMFVSFLGSLFVILLAIAVSDGRSLRDAAKPADPDTVAVSQKPAEVETWTINGTTHVNLNGTLIPSHIHERLRSIDPSKFLSLYSLLSKLLNTSPGATAPVDARPPPPVPGEEAAPAPEDAAAPPAPGGAPVDDQMMKLLMLMMAMHGG